MGHWCDQILCIPSSPDSPRDAPILDITFSIDQCLAVGRSRLLAFLVLAGGFLMLNFTVVEQTSSAEVSWPIRGWVNQSHNSTTDLSRPPNARFVLHIHSCSGNELN